METKLHIVNIGLSKLGSSRVSNLSPASTSLEKFIESNYEHWKRTELAKRRWVFAMDEEYALAQIGTEGPTDRPNVYSMPEKLLRPVRRDGADWIQRFRTILSSELALTIPVVWNVDEESFDPFMAEVLACRVAIGSVEFVTGSNTKKHAIALEYKDAVMEAARANAFVIGPEDISDYDDNFDYLSSRW